MGCVEVRNLAANANRCLDCALSRQDKNKPLGLYDCHGEGGNQHWIMSKDGEIRRDETCVDYAGRDVRVITCHGMKGNQEWRYNHQTGRMFHVASQKCLEMTSDGAGLRMEPCDASSKYQQWKFKEYSWENAKEYGVIVP